MSVPLVPVRAFASVAVNVCATPDVVPVVNDTVAAPFASVVELALANEPPAPVLLQLTTTPTGVATGWSFASTNCADTVTACPATAVVPTVTRYLVPTGMMVVVMAALDPVIEPVVAVTTWLVPPVPLVVNETVATPLAFVTLVGAANDPPFVLLHVTV